MIELERHIARLLLDNDCVIVPGFGGFIAHYIPSRYDTERGMFCPPLRTIGFNPQLTINDSLLAQSFVEACDISFPEATLRIENAVHELQDTLLAHGRYEMCGLGTITLTESGVYQFEPGQAGVLTPSLYGLTEFEMPALHESDQKDRPKTVSLFPVESPAPEEYVQDEITPQTTSADGEDETETPSQTKYLRISTNAAYRLAIACVAILLVLLIPAPAGDPSQLNLSGTGVDTNLLYRIFPKDITTGQPTLAVKTKPSKTDSTAQADTVKSAPQSRREQPSAPYYTIVMASRVTKRNAEAYVGTLHRKGMAAAKVLTCGKGTKVIYERYATRAEASRALNRLTDNVEFKDCWITEIQ